MGFLDTVRNPAFRMGLRRSVQIWRHNIPPYPALPPLDMDGILLPLPHQPSPFDRDGDLLTRNEFNDEVQAWSRKIEEVSRENDSRVLAWGWGLWVGLSLMVLFYLFLVALVGVLVFCVVVQVFATRRLT